MLITEIKSPNRTGAAFLECSAKPSAKQFRVSEQLPASRKVPPNYLYQSTRLHAFKFHANSDVR